METVGLKTQTIRAIVICSLFIVINSCSFKPSVEIEIVKVSTPTQESADYVSDVRYWYVIKNDSDIPLTIKDSYIEKTFDPMLEGLEPADLNVLSNTFILFEKDTLWGTRSIFHGSHFWERPDSTIKKHILYEDLFVLQSWLLYQQFRDRYSNCYENEKDFKLDVVRKGVLCVVIDDKVYKTKNSLPITYMPEGEYE